jgi:glycosyltransferase involved in cell wall biosynthesis
VKIAVLTSDNRDQFRDYGAPMPYFGPAPEALLQGLAEMPDAKIHIVSCTRVPMKSPEKLTTNTFYHSLHVPKIGWMRTLFQGCIRATRRKLHEIKPDIVHGQGTEHDCSISAVFSGFPNVLTIHGNMRLIAKVNKARPFSYPWLSARLERFTVPRSNGVVCITRYTQDAMKPLNPRTWILPNAVDQSFFEVTAQPLPDAIPRILVVGLICVRKNQNAFIRALDPLAKKFRFELLFLGNSWPGRAYDDDFHALVKERPWCRYGGFANRDELRRQMKDAHLMALPSLEDNCPMVILEAMAAGLPAMGAKVGGVPDLIEEGKTGLFCDPLDAASMCGAVERVLSDPAAAWQRAATARVMARERFHPLVIAREHLKIYREILQRHS